MSEPALLPVKPGSICDKDKAALRKAGVIVIEHNEPETLRLLRPWAEMDSSAMLACAINALSLEQADTTHSATKQRDAFVQGLAAITRQLPSPKPK